MLRLAEDVWALSPRGEATRALLVSLQRAVAPGRAVVAASWGGMGAVIKPPQ